MPPFIYIVMGVSGSGKSTVARTLAQQLNMHFVEADDFHSQTNIAHMAAGKPLTDDMRAPWIESLRHEIALLISQNKPATMAYSGLRSEHRQRIRSLQGPIQFILLNPSKDLISHRLNSRKDHFFAPSLLDSQFDALQLPKNEPDVMVVDQPGDVAEIVQSIIQHSSWLTERQSSLAPMANHSNSLT